ncbi:MAG: carboxypeptidase M32, partial [Phycisphaerae bacterium]
MSNHYPQLCTLVRRSGVLGSIGALVSWDQETYMPPAGAAFRSEQLGLLAELHHKHATDPKIGDLIAACEADKALLANETIAANIRELRRDYDRMTKLPTSLVSELATTTSQAQEAWKHAR